MATATPQEKKRQCYLKDRRNSYGENSKSSRKNIRRNKRAPNRANRKRTHDLLEGLEQVFDLTATEQVETQLNGARPKRWKKSADARLGDYVQSRLKRRLSLAMNPPIVATRKLKRVRRRMVSP